jgi:PAS domain S-box-containing protein
MTNAAADPGTILRHLQDGLLLLDSEGAVVYANEVLGQMLGRAPEELAGLQGADVFPAEAWRRMDPRSLLAKPGASAVHFNLELCAPGAGPVHAYCFTASTVRDDDGRAVGVLEDFRSMDQLRETILEMEEVTRLVQREKDRADLVLDSMADGVFTVDEARTIRSFSAKLEALTGVAAASAVGRSCPEVLKGTKCQTDCPLSWSFAHAQTVDRCQETLQPEGGRRVEVTVTTALLHDADGRVIGLSGAVHDHTEVERLRRLLHEQQSHQRIIGRSPRMRDLFQLIATVSDTDATVLLAGESGTGKEMVARAIHDRSPRRGRAFVTVNCAALNDNLLESELFGHVRGAFTGAVADKQGRFELAAGGTLFLDEVGDTTPALQARLLRVLQEKSFERVGDARPRTADVRVIAATNRDLEDRVARGLFREDLYYRLAVVPVQLPALRERREDIPLLVQHFIDKYRPRYFKGREERFEGISNRALARLMAYEWPGNVRELEHAIEYAMISSTTGRIERAFLPPPLRGPQGPEAPDAEDGQARGPEESPAAGRAGSPPLDDEEKALRRALEANRWSVGRTAAALGISRTTLWRRMRRHDLACLRRFAPQTPQQ